MMDRNIHLQGQHALHVNVVSTSCVMIEKNLGRVTEIIYSMASKGPPV